MQPLALYVISAILFVLGLAAIGGATFGRRRGRRQALAVAGIVLWVLTLVLYSQAIARQQAQVTGEPTPSTGQAVATATQVLPASATPEPPAPTVGPTARPIPDIPGRVVFHSTRTDRAEIWLMNANGTDLVQLTDSEGRDIEPDWSPDGQTIVFSSARDDSQDVQLYLMDASGGNQRRLMDFIAADQLGGRWSPDGQRIAFFTNFDGQFEIYVVNKDGSGLTNISNHPGNDFMPDWSPDGSRIVFVSERDSNRELYVMDATGDNQVRLTDSFYDDVRPRWSPDGTKILLESDRDGQRSLYWIPAPPLDVDGPIDQDIRLLTLPVVNDESPAWALNGEKIIFSSDRDSEANPNYEIYIMNADGSDVTRLTFDDELDRFPAWTP